MRCIRAAYRMHFLVALRRVSDNWRDLLLNNTLIRRPKIQGNLLQAPFIGNYQLPESKRVQKRLKVPYFYQIVTDVTVCFSRTRVISAHRDS